MELQDVREMVLDSGGQMTHKALLALLRRGRKPRKKPDERAVKLTQWWDDSWEVKLPSGGKYQLPSLEEAKKKAKELLKPRKRDRRNI
jgi:hypothetical protein